MGSLVPVDLARQAHQLILAGSWRGHYRAPSELNRTKRQSLDLELRELAEYQEALKSSDNSAEPSTPCQPDFVSQAL